ncbi:MAG TPA: serine/threonine-protein kinase [Gaiellaceae bacterium]
MSTEVLAGRYEIERPLGHGAMAVVDLARDRELDRYVALKRLAENLARDADLRARFLREGRLAARLAHPNIVRVFDVGEADGRPYIAMEHVDGETLADLIARGPVASAEVAELGAQAARALAAAHAAGLVHRDVKPHNLLLRRDGVLKLGDFGIAVGLEGTRLTIAGTVLGTAAYLAPEQARAEEVTAAADVYALGLVLVELLTGHPDRSARIDGPLGTTIARCLATDPRLRPTAAELERDLRSGRASAPTLILRRRRVGRAPAVLAGAAAAAIAAGIVAAVVTSGGSSKPPVPRPAPVTPVQQASTAQEQARLIARWLVRYSR